VRSKLMLAFLLSVLAVVQATADARAGQANGGNSQTDRKGTWAARSSSGLVVKGTWTAVPDAKTGTVIGTWTLDDQNGRTVSRGGWSAAKSAKGWNGSWRGIVSGSKTEYSGTWAAEVQLEPGAQFADMFELAVKNVVSGSWRAGGRSGAWSIRASK
jgi:hypothetical protein